MEIKPKSLIAVDLDGTLCEGEFWGGQEPKPKYDVIKKIEELYKAGHHIIICTARHRNYYQETEAWLIKYKVWYHALSMEKMGCDLLIDDKVLNVKDIEDIEV